MNAIERIRAALAALSDYNHDTTGKYRVAFNRACNPAAMAEVLAHIDAQQARIDMLHAEIAQVWQPKHDAQQAEIERLKADAERYQWLQKEHQLVDPVCAIVWKRGLNRNGSDWVNTTAIDADIDAAMKEST